MTGPSEDELAEFGQLVAELEQRLEQSFIAHDQIVARQAANEEENARLRTELAAARELKTPLASIPDLAKLSVELTGKLADALKPAALDDKTRAEVDELMRQLADNLGQLTQQAQAELGSQPADAEKGPGDPWAAEIDALYQEFPGLGPSGEPASQESPVQDVADQELPAEDSLDHASSDQKPSEQALPSKAQG